RGPVLGRVRPHLRARHLPLRRLRRRAFPLRDEVRFRLRLAGVLRAGGRPGDRRGDGLDPRDGPYRGDVLELRRTPRARVPRRPCADGTALLHQFGCTRTGGGVVKKRATFGAGCFWGVEAAFRQIDGVTRTRVGYSGGTLESPTYEDVCSHATGHAEVVEVTYDPERV